MPKIALIDDHSLFLDGVSRLVALIDPSFDIETFNDGNVFLDNIANGNVPNVVLCDLTMKPMNGLEVLSNLGALTRSVPVIILSAIDNAKIAETAKAAGAFAFLSKSVSSDDLEVAIWSALGVGKKFKTAPDAAKAPQLTDRQMDIVRLISTGHTNKTASDQLGISENTVKTHLRQAFLQLGVTKRVECVEKARALGLI